MHPCVVIGLTKQRHNTGESADGHDAHLQGGLRACVGHVSRLAAAWQSVAGGPQSMLGVSYSSFRLWPQPGTHAPLRWRPQQAGRVLSARRCLRVLYNCIMKTKMR